MRLASTKWKSNEAKLFPSVCLNNSQKCKHKMFEIGVIMFNERVNNINRTAFKLQKPKREF